MFDPRLPLWYQLAEVLRTEVLLGQLEAGGRVPPEVELARRFGVSVVTVRQALDVLRHEGLLSRHVGRGTFTSPVPADRKLVVLSASSGSQVSSDYDKARHGLFTYALLRGLRGEADADSSGLVTVGDLYGYV